MAAAAGKEQAAGRQACNTDQSGSIRRGTGPRFIPTIVFIRMVVHAIAAIDGAITFIKTIWRLGLSDSLRMAKNHHTAGELVLPTIAWRSWDF